MNNWKVKVINNTKALSQLNEKTLFPCRKKKNESQLLPRNLQKQFEIDHKTKYKSQNQKASRKYESIYSQPEQNAQTMKEKIDKLDLTNIKIFYSSKVIILKMWVNHPDREAQPSRLIHWKKTEKPVVYKYFRLYELKIECFTI